jgi:DNA-directed RNA polymerase specialized sigma24 family protein
MTLAEWLEQHNAYQVCKIVGNQFGMGKTDEIDDLFQRLFLRLKNLELVNIENPQAFCFHTAFNLARDRARSDKRRKKRSEQIALADQAVKLPAESCLLVDEYVSEICKLEQKDRQIVVSSAVHRMEVAGKISPDEAQGLFEMTQVEPLPPPESELEAESRAHQARRIRDKIEKGLTPDQKELGRRSNLKIRSAIILLALSLGIAGAELLAHALASVPQRAVETQVVGHRSRAEESNSSLLVVLPDRSPVMGHRSQVA